MSRIIEWREPPTTGTRGAQQEVDDTVEELKRHPGKWAHVGTGKSSSSSATWKRRGCEARCVGVAGHPGKYDTYARWPSQEATAKAQGQQAAADAQRRAAVAKQPAKTAPENVSVWERDSAGSLRHVGILPRTDDLVELTVNGRPTGKWVKRGPQKPHAGNGYTAADRAARGIPTEGKPL